MLKFFALALALASPCALADNTASTSPLTPGDPMIQLDAGLGASVQYFRDGNNDSGNEKVLGAALLRVHGSFDLMDQQGHVYGGDAYVATTITGDGYSVSVPYVDVKLEFFRFGAQKEIQLKDGSKWIIQGGLNTLAMKMLNDKGLGLGESVQVSVVGAWMRADYRVTDDVSFFARAVADLAGFMYAKHDEPSNNGLGESIGYSPSLRLTAGLTFFDKLRITLDGSAVGQLAAQACFDSNAESCQNDPRLAQGRALGGIFQVSTSVSYDITKFLRVFAQLDSNYYVMSTRNDPTPALGGIEHESDIVFLIGLSGTLGY